MGMHHSCKTYSMRTAATAATAADCSCIVCMVGIDNKPAHKNCLSIVDSPSYIRYSRCNTCHSWKWAHSDSAAAGSTADLRDPRL